MSDDALRRFERALASDPASLALRREHVALLERAGLTDEALAALDLAWRLGADDLFDELARRREARALRLWDDQLELRYVPAGPFVLGTSEADPGGRPARLADAGPFWVAARPLSRALLAWHEERRRGRSPARSPWQHPLVGELTAAIHAIATLDRAERPPEVGGRLVLIDELRWERALRACLLRPDGRSPYGVELDPSRPEWTSDAFAPPEGTAPLAEARQVVRGVPGVPLSVRVLHREQARRSGVFEVPLGRHVQPLHVYEGVACRPVLLPGPA